MTGAGIDPSDSAALVPVYLRQRLEAEGYVLRAGQGQGGVVLLADLVGYSRICATLVDTHARSAEEIGGFLNRLLELMADCIARHGGSVVTLAGDAAISIWPAPDAGDVPDAVARALTCAQELQRISSDQRDPILAPVRLQVSVAAGPVWVADVGLGAGRRHLHAAGPVLEDLATLGALTGPGQVAMPIELRDLLGDGVTGHGHGAGFIVDGLGACPAEPPAVTDAASDTVAPAPAAYVAASTASLVRAGDRRWLAEFRRASVLFLAIDGFSAAMTGAADRLDRLFSAIGAAIEATDGLVLQAINDDKGLLVQAVWGLATNTHEDDAARCVLAALDAQDAVQEQGFGCRAGIATGKVFAGLIGHAQYRQYAVLGDAVNRASALSRLSGDRLRADTATADAADARFTFAPPVEVPLKGWQTPWAVHADPQEQASTRVETHAFVGRRRELAAISEMVMDRPGEAAPILLIEAEAGMGKSRLAGQARTLLADQGLRHVDGAGDVLRRTTGLHMWRAIFARLLGDAPMEPRLSALVADDPVLAGRLPLLNPVLPQDLPDTPETQGFDTATRGRLLVDTVAEVAARLLRDTADWLVIEDAHWLDSSSWLVLTEVHRRMPGLGLMLVSRVLDRAALPRETATMFQETCLVEMPLAALPHDETAELASAVLGVTDLPGDLARLIHDRAEGHPLYVKELTLSLRDRGIIRTRGQHCSVRLGEDGVAAIEFPDGVEGVVADRISTLDPTVQLTLKAAAVCGRRFDLAQLSSIRPGGVEAATLSAHLQAILRTGLIEARAGQADRFRFHHAIIQDTAHSLLLREQRMELHSAAARWMEGQGDAGDAAPVIAFHWSNAEEHDRAVDWYERAAHGAQAGNAPAEVVEFTSRARDHADRASRRFETDRRGRWLYLEGNALMSLGYYRRGADTLRGAIALLDAPLPAGKAGAIWCSLREFMRLKTGVRPGSIPSEQRDTALMVAEALHALSEITYQHGDIPQTLAGALYALNLGERAGGDSPIMAKILMGIAFVGMSAPWAIDPLAYRDRALAMCERLEDDLTWSWVLFVAGVFEMGQGNFPTAQTHLGRCPPICERVGEWKNWFSSMANYGNALRVEGRVAASQAVDVRLLEVALDRGNVLAQVWSRTAIAKNHVYLGEFDALDDCLDRLDVLFATPENVTEGSTDNYMTLHLAHASARVRAGRDADALVSMAEVARLLDSMASPGIYGMEPVMMMCDLIEIMRLRGADPGRLAAVMRSTVGYGSRLARQYPGARAKLAYARGDGAAMAGRHRRAARFWEAARVDAAARGLYLDEAQASLRLAQRAGHDDAAALRARADTILRDLDLAKPPLWAAQEP